MSKNHPATVNLLSAARDLMTLRAWIRDREKASASEIMGAVARLDTCLEVWSDHGHPDAPESVELEGS